MKPSASAGDERHAEAVHRQHDDVAADHGEAAVGEVDEAHQPHGHRQADRHDEQHHAGGQAAEQHVGEFDDEITATRRKGVHAMARRFIVTRR